MLKCADSLENVCGCLGMHSGACKWLAGIENVWKHMVAIEKMGKWLRIG